MSDDPARPPRRRRYSGRNPRAFADKYKELDPTRYPEHAAKVIASGKTPAGSHVPVMVDECMAALRPAPGDIGVDATLGYGGHAQHLLKAITPGGRLVGLDQDPQELPKTIERLQQAGFGPGQFDGLRSNYAGIRAAMTKLGIDTAQFILADLGCSSMQLDNPERGFSFKHDGPLDMRMNPQRGLSAADWLARTSPARFAMALREHADEPAAERLADHLAGKKFASTRDLAEAVNACMPAHDPERAELALRRVFQALRIAVNDEFSALDAFLKALPDCLAPGGRLAILSFHSGEDRRVKQSLLEFHRQGIYTTISDGVITAGPDERHINPRSIPAKLRWAVRA